MHRLPALGLFVLLLPSGCSGRGEPSPFLEDAGAGADAPVDVAPSDGRSADGPKLGQACLDDGQCDDGIDCTHDSCNRELKRCQFVSDDSRCQNGVFCDGIEKCDSDVGCRQGSNLDCSDDLTCTIDSCLEETRTCAHRLRDADDDGVPDVHCMPMEGDCDDSDPTVYSGHVEVCGNRKDDNCDGRIDETGCQKPVHDTCLDPLSVGKTGVFELDTTAATFDYAGTCAPMDPATRRDVVAALEVPSGPLDVDIVAEAPSGSGGILVGLAKDCGVLGSELACGIDVPGPGRTRIARIRQRSLAKGAYPVYVWTDRDEKVLLHVTLGPPTTAPTNETCGTAIPIVPGTPVVASWVDSKKDLASRCGFEGGDLVYKLELPAASDVTAFAISKDVYGEPIVSIRRDSCATSGTAPDEEIACGFGSHARAFARALPKGTYYVAVSTSLKSDVELQVDVSAPTAPPADETCMGASLLTPNRTLQVSLLGHSDDIDMGCGPIGATDAAYTLDLAGPSDVLLMLRTAAGDTGAVSLATPTCAAPLGPNACAKGRDSPLRASVRGVPAGSYRTVVETVLGNPVELTAFVRPAVPPTLVPFADTCATATSIAEGGGFYQGNTANAAADYSAGCDNAGTPPGGAADQIMKFTLTSRKRVVFDMKGSNYWTLLNVRKGATCPGLELPGSCSVGCIATNLPFGCSGDAESQSARSFLDLTLDPGVYWVQIDGFLGSSGAWFLDVRVADVQ